MLQALGGKLGMGMVYLFALILIALVSASVYATLTAREAAKSVEIIRQEVRTQCNKDAPTVKGCQALLSRLLRYADKDQLGALRGPAGPMGLQGPMGATGARGATGATGARGLRGTPGARGSRGARGTIGATGPAGTSTLGPPGPPGIQGPQGPPGIPDTGKPIKLPGVGNN